MGPQHGLTGMHIRVLPAVVGRLSKPAGGLVGIQAVFGLPKMLFQTVKGVFQADAPLIHARHQGGCAGDHDKGQPIGMTGIVDHALLIQDPGIPACGLAMRAFQVVQSVADPI